MSREILSSKDVSRRKQEEMNSFLDSPSEKPQSIVSAHAGLGTVRFEMPNEKDFDKALETVSDKIVLEGDCGLTAGGQIEGTEEGMKRADELLDKLDTKEKSSNINISKNRIGVEKPMTMAEPGQKADDYANKLIKYIPSEVIALYITLSTVLKSSADVPAMLDWIIFIVCTAGVYFYLLRIQKVTKQKQLIISVLSFIVWIFAFGGPFADLGWYKPIYGGLLLPVFTFFIPIIEV
jgi:hypothetical protein